MDNNLIITMTTDSVTRVLIVGGGGIGLIYAGCLSRVPGVEVSIYARSNYKALKEQGAFIRVPDNEALSFSFRPKELFDAASTEVYKGETFDYVVVASKSLGTKALTGLHQFIDPSKTVLALFQNGIDIEKPYLAEYPGVAVASAVIRVAAAMNGAIEATFYGARMSFKIGLVHDAGKAELFNSKLVALKELSEKANPSIPVEIVTNFALARWEKMLWNGTFNTIASITDLSTGGVFSSGMEPLVRQVMTEIWNVGATIVGDDWVPLAHVDQQINFTKTQVPAGFLPSTLQDVRRGVEIEIEGIVGNTIRAAKEHNVPVPTLETIYMLLKGVNYRLQQSSI